MTEVGTLGQPESQDFPLLTFYGAFSGRLGAAYWPRNVRRLMRGHSFLGAAHVFCLSRCPTYFRCAVSSSATCPHTLRLVPAPCHVHTDWAWRPLPTAGAALLLPLLVCSPGAAAGRTTRAVRSWRTNECGCVDTRNVGGPAHVKAVESAVGPSTC